ncbi:wall-associated receptor kinase-like 22 [Neltuma alba]|uniref:wall-associated receptor kinase-like 22 n=1 Tax=Neltuma alba TaxID=207710 RepID=UPI0010A38BB0|nr:wall-associated receptor kinase-like 22 [Prosopis alba]XP_028784382.1 wall-associated receptor kinase-like 22 [Prosopis alba]XP_028784383.1 wall-associated receptor kinase-like 22 [Prosopis alba]
MALHLLFISLLPLAALASPNCNSTCGNITISPPFGMNEPRCYHNEWFEINCSQDSAGIHKPYLKKIRLEVTKFDYSSCKVWVNNPIYSWHCKIPATRGGANVSLPLNMTASPFAYSREDNVFLGAGCDTQALLLQGSHDGVFGGCVSICSSVNLNHSAIGGCLGQYCCTASLPRGLSEYNPRIEHVAGNHGDCSYALIVEDKGQNDWGSRILSSLSHSSSVPAVLEYYSACNVSDILSSEALNSPLAPQCASPLFPGANPCGSTGGRGNSRSKSQSLSVIGVVFSSLVSVVFLVGVWIQYKIFRKSRINKRKEKYFKQNGGLLLQRSSLNGDVSFDKTKLFGSKDLEKATDRFNVNRVLGKGGQGTVYKGMLADGQIVAVKKLRLQGNVEEFINEVVILSQINHRNVVRLLGFCLETQVPLLVYEFIPNGNLYEHLHEQNEEISMTWDARLRIAGEVAGALFYLHSAASRPIYHRDIKSTNILLDDKLRAKVADFGTSRMLSMEKTHITTQVQGTFGYLDPEYFHTSQFTDKSDVYSFGVVLVELLTGQVPISCGRPQEAQSLASYFIMCMHEGRLCEIVDPRITEEAKEDITAVAHLARRCLSLNGRTRPSMREVTAELEGIQRLRSRSCNMDPQIYEEIELGAALEGCQIWGADYASSASTLNTAASHSSSQGFLVSEDR